MCLFSVRQIILINLNSITEAIIYSLQWLFHLTTSYYLVLQRCHVIFLNFGLNVKSSGLSKINN